VSSTLGSPDLDGRGSARSRAGSFSMCLRTPDGVRADQCRSPSRPRRMEPLPASNPALAAHRAHDGVQPRR